MKYFTTPAAEDLSLEEAYVLVCLRERCDIAGIVRNIIPLVESIYSKVSKGKWIEIVGNLQASGTLYYGKDTIILANPPYTYQNRNHAIAAMGALSSLNQTILSSQAASTVIGSIIIRVGTEAKGKEITIPSNLIGIASTAIKCHMDAIGMPSECHPNAMPMHPHLNNINFNFNFNFNSTSPSTPQAGKPAGRRKEEGRKDSSGGQAPQTPQDKRDWNGVLLSEQEAEKLLQKYPNLDLIDLTQEVADYYDLKAQEIKHPYQACVKWAESKLKKEAR